MPWFRAWTLGLVVAVSVLLSGCTTVVAGHAARDKDAVPVDVAPLKESQLGDVLLTADELDTITGSTTMAVTSDVDQLSDSSRLVSDPECLGAIFGAEEQVYGKGLTAVRDQIVREPHDDKEHWAEQTLALYPSPTKGQKFFSDSEASWKDCGGFSVAVDDGEGSYIWEVNDLTVDDDLITQVVTQQDSGGWDCQHALTAVSNITIETWACAYGVHDEAANMARELVAKAAKVGR